MACKSIQVTTDERAIVMWHIMHTRHAVPNDKEDRNDEERMHENRRKEAVKNKFCTKQ